MDFLFLLSESRITRMTQITRILRELAVKSTPHTYTVFGRDRGYKPLPQEKGNAYEAYECNSDLIEGVS